MKKQQKQDNDNRMLWIRHCEQSQKDYHKPECNYREEYSEYEFASEALIPGILDFENGKIFCGSLTLEQDRDGIYHYLMRVKENTCTCRPFFNQKADEEGYHFEGGIFGELMSLFSLFFQCRFYPVASFRGELNATSIKEKIEYDFSRRRIRAEIDKKPYPEIFNFSSRRNFADDSLITFLEDVKKLESKKHQNFIQSCYSYLKALREIGLDKDMFFIRMVSAIEGLAKYEKITTESSNLNEDNLRNFYNTNEVPESIRNKFKSMLERERQQQKLTKQFIQFIKTRSQTIFESQDQSKSNFIITPDTLEKWLEKIYKARSSYLHEAKQMLHSQILSDPNVFGEIDYFPNNSIIDNRQYSHTGQLPYHHWFGKITRHCLLKFAN